MSDIATFDDMTIEAIEVACQSAFEECESVFRAIDSKKNQLEIFGRLLTAAKKKVAHGEWENWLTDTFQGRLKLRTAQLWMSKAQKVALLDSDEKPHIVPRAERKTGRVKVTESNHPESSDSSPERDPDPNPAPKTNTLHKPATAKAKEANRLVPAAVTPEIVDDVAEILQSPWIKVEESLCTIAEEWQLLGQKERKQLAKKLKKLHEQIDPPTVGAPSIEAVEAWATENRFSDFDADKFFNHYELAGWKYGKAKTPIKDWQRAAANAYANGKGWAVNGANRLPF